MDIWFTRIINVYVQSLNTLRIKKETNFAITVLGNTNNDNHNPRNKYDFSDVKKYFSPY